jgi:L-asparaginase / beta-aspartyl-peptidase
MIVVASSNGKIGICAAMDVLRSGGSALDAVETGTKAVEEDPSDHSVGFGGLPNLEGEVELDASIMDGRTLAVGAVSGLKGYVNAVSVARRLMTDLPHVLLVGDGASAFAESCGFHKKDLLTDEAIRIWKKRLHGMEAPEATHGDLRYYKTVRDWLRDSAEPRQILDTVDFLAMDAQGNIASAVSTSGWEWKYPGRAADSAVIGAGNYCDNRAGAAACTGRGEMAIRTAAAHSVVLRLQLGMPLDEALAAAMKEMSTLEDPYYSTINIVAIDAAGSPAAVTNGQSTFIYMSDDMASYAEVERKRVIAPNGRVADLA